MSDKGRVTGFCCLKFGKAFDSIKSRLPVGKLCLRCPKNHNSEWRSFKATAGVVLL